MPRKMLTDAYWEKLSEVLMHTGRVYNKAESWPRNQLNPVASNRYGNLVLDEVVRIACGGARRRMILGISA